MVFEKHLVLFILILHFLCALCNDDALQEETIIISHPKSSYNSGAIISLADINDTIAETTSSSTTNDSETTESITNTTDYESTTDTIESTFPSTTENVMQTTQSETTVTPDDVTSTESTTIDPMICDPLWPVNASVDTREIINLKVHEVNTENIILLWEPPCNNAINVSIIYLIEKCENENCSQINETDTWYNATDLDPCTQYTFNIKVLTEFWESDGLSIIAKTGYNISEIGDVLDLSVRNVSVNVVQLIWHAPEIHAKCISNYSITQCDERFCNETVVSVTNYTANNLEPCTKYHFTVKTITQAVQSAGVNETAKTASPKLSAPQFLRVLPGNFSLTVTWDPPDSGTTCLKHYHISIDPNKSIFNTTETNITIYQLHACTKYQVYVNAMNEDNVEGDTVTKSNTTCRFRTNPPVYQGPDKTPGINELSMTWRIDKENNHCPLQYIITKCNYTASDGNSYLNGTSVQEICPEKAVAPVVVMTTVIDGLMPFTNYTCWAFTVNTATDSESSELVNATTAEDVPSPPTFDVDIDDSHFTLSWKQPENLAGILKMFEIVINWTISDSIPDWCAHENSLSFSIELNETTFDYDYTEAKAFTIYEIKMRAKTGAGWGAYSEPKSIQTKHGIPEAVTKFNSSSIIVKENSNDTNMLDTILTWGLPCSLNGELEAFIVSVYGTRNGYSPDSFFMMHDCKNYIDNDYMCSINLNELKGEYNYTFTISTKIMHVDIPGPATSQSRLYPAGIPPQPDNEYIESIKLDPYKARRTTTTATVLLPLFPDTNGDIKYYAVMISEKGHNKPLTKRFDLNSKTWPNISSWEEAMISDFSITYQATRPKWDPYQNHIADYGRIKAVKYTIGEDTTCKEISSNNDKRLYCNGPLKPDTTYEVRMRAFTYGGYSDSKVSFEIKTNAELKVALVIGTVFSILFVGIVVTMMLLVRKCSPYLVLRRFLHSDMPGSPVPAPFTRKKFISHCQQLVDNPGKLSNEFRLLQTLSVDLQMPTNTACLQANRKKNRYSDILPYDFSRVKLEVIDNDPNTDYINASFIRGYTGEDEYIACQGPKEETTYDFWRMVDQYNINIIVMLTQLVEKGKEKCHQYYPAIKETFRYENMTIRCTSELDFRTHTQRTLILQKENKKRSIIHLHFKDWPDHDVPEDFDAMINFCQIMRRNISTNKGFIVVHCSAGIGRTGTLIAIDILLQHLRDNRKLDVFGIVYRLRHHRINMVQRESQYAYIYNCIKQVLKNPYFLKTYKPPPVDPIYENISKKAKDVSNTDTNLVNNLEILKKYNSSISMSSLESIYNLFPWSITKNQRSTISSGLRHYKSMGAINVKTHHITIEKSQTLDRVFFKSLKNSVNELNKDSRIQESLPLLTCSIDILGDSAQNATDTYERDDSIM